MSDPQSIARQAERDLNTYEAKTGAGRSSSNDDAGVDTSVESKFPGSKVTYGDDLVTNAGYNRRIPEDEGGDLDDKGRQTRGADFDGEGGPEDKAVARARDAGGEDDEDVVGNSINRNTGKDVLAEGEDAGNANLAGGLRKKGGNFKGEDYYDPQSVDDSIADQGNIAPDSVIQASNTSEGVGS